MGGIVLKCLCPFKKYMSSWRMTSDILSKEVPIAVKLDILRKAKNARRKAAL